MQHYVPGQGLVQVDTWQSTAKVRLEVNAIVQRSANGSDIGHVVFLDPSAAKLLGNELIAHALRVQAEQVYKAIGKEDEDVLY